MMMEYDDADADDADNLITWKWQSLRPSQPASPLVLRSPHQYPPSAEGSYNHHGRDGDGDI